MKTLLCVLVILFSTVGIALAVGTASVSVSATVVGTCKFNSGDAFTFVLDPTSGLSPSVTQSNATLQCTNGTGYTITDNGGLLGTYLLDSGTSTIGYTINYPTTGTGDGASNPIPVTVTIPYANYQFSPVGVYNDTVTLTVNP